MHSITFREQCSLDRKIRECGMQWAIAMKKWIKRIRVLNAMKEQNMAKIEKELRCTNWENYTTLWDLSHKQ